MDIDPHIAAFAQEFQALRRDLHAHPELGFEEARTSQVVAEQLAAYGCEVTRGVGKTGVVGTLRAGTSERSLGLRADMDALPMDEVSVLPHRSRHAGRMHACGHDGHTAILLAAARYLAQTRRFDGTVHFIFQPAEEGRGGALAMLDDGLFERFPCDVIFGLHNRPKLEVGKLALRTGPMMAGGGLFDIEITGKGAHGARPEVGIDPIVIAGHMITALQTVVSRSIPAADSGVVSITQVHAGDAYNVIPERAVLRGTIRAFTPQVMAALKAHIERIANGIAASFGGKVSVDVRVVFPPLVNDAAEASFLCDVAAEVVGAENVRRDTGLIMASEDFSYMLERVPGAFIMLGNGGGDGACEVHNPGYDFNDEALPLGATLWARVVERRLSVR